MKDMMKIALGGWKNLIGCCHSMKWLSQERPNKLLEETMKPVEEK
jgi:hypothetical protein